MKQTYVLPIDLLKMLIEIKKCISLNICSLRAKFIQSNCFPIELFYLKKRNSTK